jgi:hypothetical protein
MSTVLTKIKNALDHAAIIQVSQLTRATYIQQHSTRDSNNGTNNSYHGPAGRDDITAGYYNKPDTNTVTKEVAEAGKLTSTLLKGNQRHSESHTFYPDPEMFIRISS